MDKLLNALGLMRRSECRKIAERFAELSVANCEKSDEIAALDGAISSLRRDLRTSGARNAVMSRRIDDLLEEIDSLRPDAELWRAARAKRSAKP